MTSRSNRHLVSALGFVALGLISFLMEPVTRKDTILGIGSLLLAAAHLKFWRDAQKDVSNDK